MDTINFTDLDSSRANDAADIAMNLGVRGMNAIVTQIAKEFAIPLFTLDNEMIEKSSSLIDIRNLDEF